MSLRNSDANFSLKLIRLWFAICLLWQPSLLQNIIQKFLTFLKRAQETALKGLGQNISFPFISEFVSLQKAKLFFFPTKSLEIDLIHGGGLQ